MRLRVLFSFLALLVLAACGDNRPAMVSTANEHASKAALAMLDRGGSAVDAAIAAQLVLSLVEPQSSGIGGGAFMLYRDAGDGEMVAYDGREMAPQAAGGDLFLKPDGEPMGFMEAVIGGRSVGVPGVVAMLWTAHQEHGRLDWADLFRPAIGLAHEGFAVSPRLHEMIARDKWLRREPATRDYFFVADPASPDGLAPLPVGHVLKNPAYARTLETIAEQGPEGFYEGEVAGAIVQAVTSHPNRGLMTLGDLKGYEARARDPLCRPYRAYEVCGMPPPTSGGLTTLMILGMLEPFELSAMRPGSRMAVHLVSEASALAFADRAVYMADADFVPVPVGGLLDRGYLRSRARLIDPLRATGKAKAGTPPGLREARANGSDLTRPGTSHLSIVDGEGNAVSMTTSVEGPFGSHLMAGGFILNNQLTDFSFVPERDGTPVANRVEGGKRPRSSMSPTLVLDGQGDLFAAVGSPGGSRIIGYVTETLIALMDWKLDMQAAIDLPRFVDRNGPVELEAGTPLDALKGPLEAMGHEVTVRPLTSGLHGVRETAAGLDGGADPRREGVVLTTRED